MRFLLVALGAALLAVLFSTTSAGATHMLTIEGARVYNSAVREFRNNTFCLTTDVPRDLSGEQARILRHLNEEPGWNLVGYGVVPEPDCSKADIEVRYNSLGNTWWVARVWIQGLTYEVHDGVPWWRQDRFIVEINADRYFPLSDWSKKLVINHEWGHVVGPLNDHPTDTFGCERLLMNYCWLVNEPQEAELAAIRAHYGLLPTNAPKAAITYDNPVDARLTLLAQWGIENLHPGDVVRADGTPWVYWVGDDGMLHWITSPARFEAQWRWEWIKVVNAGVLIPWPQGDPLY